MPLTDAERQSLQRAIDLLQRRLDDHVDATVETLTRDYTAAIRGEIEEAFRALPTGADGKFDETAIRGVLPAVRRKLLGTDAAYRTIGDAWLKRLDATAEQVREGFEVDPGQQRVDWSRLDLDVIDELKGVWPKPGEGSGLAGRFFSLTDEHRRALADALTRAVLGRRKERDLIEELGEVVEKDGRNAKWLLDDGTMQFSRAVHLRKADSLGYEWFIYVGPQDAITRPFCSPLINTVHTRAEIDDMDNRQTGAGTVMIAGGGYRCRHHWRAVRPEWYEPDEWEAMGGERATSVEAPPVPEPEAVIEAPPIPEIDAGTAENIEKAGVRGLDPRTVLTEGRFLELLTDIDDSVSYQPSAFESITLPDGTKRDLIVRTMNVSAFGREARAVEMLIDGDAENRIEYVPGMTQEQRARLKKIAEARGEGVARWMDETPFSGQFERMINAASANNMRVSRFEWDPDDLPDFLASASKGAPEFEEWLDTMIERDARNLPTAREQAAHILRTGQARPIAFNEAGLQFERGDALAMTEARRSYIEQNVAEWARAKERAQAVLEARERMEAVPSISDQSWEEWKQERDKAYDDYIAAAKRAAPDFEALAQAIAGPPRPIDWEWDATRPHPTATQDKIDARLGDATKLTGTIFGASHTSGASVAFGYAESRAHHDKKWGINVGDAVRIETQVHELGHWLEETNRTLGRGAQNYLFDHMTDPTPIEALADEWAVSADFADTYTSKIYPKNRAFEPGDSLPDDPGELAASEVTPMAIMEWVDGEHMAKQYARDPNLFWWSASVASGDFQ